MSCGGLYVLGGAHDGQFQVVLEEQIAEAAFISDALAGRKAAVLRRSRGRECREKTSRAVIDGKIKTNLE